MSDWPTHIKTELKDTVQYSPHVDNIYLSVNMAGINHNEHKLPSVGRVHMHWGALRRTRPQTTVDF